MRDRKLVGSRQRSLSSRFSLSRRERPLLAGKQIIIQDSGNTCQETSKSDPTHNFAIQCSRASNQHVFAPFVL